MGKIGLPKSHPFAQAHRQRHTPTVCIDGKNGPGLLPAALTQKAAISAINHGPTVSDEADRAVP